MARMAFWIACPTLVVTVAHVAPVRAGRNLEAMVLGERGVVHVPARLVQRPLALLVVHVAQPLEEEQREDELLVVARVDQPAQQRRRAPQVGFELGLGDAELGSTLTSWRLETAATVAKSTVVDWF